MKKVLIYGAVVVLIIIAVLAIIWVPRIYDFYHQQFLTQKILGEVKVMEDSYKNDPYGGATPEETLQGFIIALKAGDVETASNYFVPEKREEYKKKIESWKDNGKLEQVAKYFSYKQTSKVLNNMVALVTFSYNGDAVLMLEFSKNKYSGKWLIESL